MTTVGAVLYLATRTDLVTDLPLFLSWQTVRGVWSDPALLATGLQLSLPTLLILLCHELGHYLACRHYRYPVSPPYFLPAPFGLGTLGAFIRIGAPVRSKRELFDIGAAGPLAGFVALLPFLVWGIAASKPVPLPPPPAGIAEMILLVPGQSLGMQLVAWLAARPAARRLHPRSAPVRPGRLGRAAGHRAQPAAAGAARRRSHPLLAGGPPAPGPGHRRCGSCLLALGLAWPGWVLWCLVILVLGLRHPPVADESGPSTAGGRRSPRCCC